MSTIENIIEKCAGNEMPPCQAACPLHVDMKGAIALIRQSKFSEAVKLIREKLPLPGVMGRICMHPCEYKCKRQDIEESVAIANLRRAACEYGGAAIENSGITGDNGRKVAVVGGGPAGIMAAHDLRLKGYRVTIIEALPFIGGMLAAGIPEFRLPRDILRDELAFIEKSGIEIKLNTKVGIDIQLSDLKKNYDAVFLAVGAHMSQPLNIENETSEGVISGVEFLQGINSGRKMNAKGSAVIVGGGNVAIDCARTCLRSGFREVIILYRRSRTEMPAINDEVLEAEREGLRIEFLSAPVKILAENGMATGIQCIRMNLGEADATGRKRPVPIKNSEFTINADLIISAIGELPDLRFLNAEENKLLNKESLLPADSVTLETGVAGVFAGGDAVTGPASVIEALAAGRKAAISIDRRIRGEDLYAGRENEGPQESKLTVSIEGIPVKKRACTYSLPPDQRKGNLNEVNLGLSKEDAVSEAERCLQCECRLCVQSCEFLKSCCDSPKGLAEKLKNGYYREKPEVPYLCNLCSLCEVQCPQHLNIGKMCHELRERMVADRSGPLPRHQTLVDDQVWAASDSFFMVSPGSKGNECKRFFFPGCSLSAYSPDLVIKTYEYIQDKLPGTGIILGCCGAPSYELGDCARFQHMLGKITAGMEESGVSELIVACPDCYHIFKENAPHIQLTTVYELMVEKGLPEVTKAENGKIFSIHDSCKARYESGIQDSVRKIAAELGYTIEEPEFTKSKTRCCGMGGMVAYVDMKLVNRIIMGRVKELPHDILTYCASCRNAFALTGKPSVHILDIIFGSDLEKTRRKSPVIGAARRKNQSELKSRLTGIPTV